MPVGGFYFDKRELDEFAKKLEATAGDIKDLTKLYREIGKKAGEYVKAHEPLPSYDTSKNSSSHLPLGYLQSQTKGSGGKGGAWVTIRNVPYLMLQEFGGGVRWVNTGAGTSKYLQKTIIGVSKRGHYKTRMRRAYRGHVIYTKPRRRMGYFVWNVAYRLRGYIGETLTEGIAVMAEQHGLLIDVVNTELFIDQKPGPTG